MKIRVRTCSKQFGIVRCDKNKSCASAAAVTILLNDEEYIHLCPYHARALAKDIAYVADCAVLKRRGDPYAD